MLFPSLLPLLPFYNEGFLPKVAERKSTNIKASHLADGGTSDDDHGKSDLDFRH